MWKHNENGSDTKPSDIDQISSKVYVFIRKDFELIPSDGEDRPAHWCWMEQKIKKSDWELYEKLLNHDIALDDVYAALTELAEIIAGEE